MRTTQPSLCQKMSFWLVSCTPIIAPPSRCSCVQYPGIHSRESGLTQHYLSDRRLGPGACRTAARGGRATHESGNCRESARNPRGVMERRARPPRNGAPRHRPDRPRQRQFPARTDPGCGATCARADLSRSDNVDLTGVLKRAPCSPLEVGGGRREVGSAPAARQGATRRIAGSVKTSCSSVLRVLNSDTTAPSAPAWNQCHVFGGMVC